MGNFKAGQYSVLLRIINGYLVASSPEFGITVTKRFDEIRKMEEAGKVYFDVLKKITEEVDRRKLKNERLPEPRKALDLVPKGEPPSLSVTDVAKILQVGPDTVRRLADNRKLKCSMTPGGHRRFKVSEIENYVGLCESALGTLEAPGDRLDPI